MKVNHRSGMTLIEVTAATALAVLLVAAMSGVLRSLRTQKAALADDEFQPAWQRQLVDDLRWDLTNSQDMATRPCQLKLLGFSGRDSNSREATHRLTEICYTIRETNGQHLLVRQEISLDDKSVQLGPSKLQGQELIAVGITGIILTSLEDTIEKDAASKLLSKGKKVKMNDQWIPIPKQFRLILIGEDQELVIDEVLVL